MTTTVRLRRTAALFELCEGGLLFAKLGQAAEKRGATAALTMMLAGSSKSVFFLCLSLCRVNMNFEPKAKGKEEFAIILYSKNYNVLIHVNYVNRLDY